MVPRMSVVPRPSQGSPVSFKRRPRKKAAPSWEPCRICSARKPTRLLPTPTRHRASRQKPLINYLQPEHRLYVREPWVFGTLASTGGGTFAGEEPRPRILCETQDKRPEESGRGRHGCPRHETSRQQGLDHFGFFDAGQAHIEALVLVAETLVVDAELVQDGGLEIAHMDRVAGDVITEVVGFTVDHAALDAATGHP